MKTDRPTQYRIFLLTFWLADNKDITKPERWHFRIEEPNRQTSWGIVGLGNLLLQLAHKINGRAKAGNETNLENLDSATSSMG